jgi:hypothetical protein
MHVVSLYVLLQMIKSKYKIWKILIVFVDDVRWIKRCIFKIAHVSHWTIFKAFSWVISISLIFLNWLIIFDRQCFKRKYQFQEIVFVKIFLWNWIALTNFLIDRYFKRNKSCIFSMSQIRLEMIRIEFESNESISTFEVKSIYIESQEFNSFIFRFDSISIRQNSVKLEVFSIKEKKVRDFLFWTMNCLNFQQFIYFVISIICIRIVKWNIMFKHFSNWLIFHNNDFYRLTLYTEIHI